MRAIEQRTRSLSLGGALAAALCLLFALTVLVPPAPTVTAPAQVSPPPAPAQAPPPPPDLLLVDWPAADAAQRRSASAALAALRNHLRAGGLTAGRTDLAGLASVAAPAGVVAVVPWTGAAPADLSPLRRFVSGGGRVLLFAPASAAAVEALGGRAGGGTVSGRPALRPATDGGKKPRLLGAPAETRGPAPAGVGVVPGAEERVLLYWQTSGRARPAAAVRVPGGIVARLRLPEEVAPECARLVVSLAAALKPGLWESATAELRTRAEGRLSEAEERAATLARRDPPVRLDARGRNALADGKRRLQAAADARTPEAAATGYPGLLTFDPPWRMAPSEPGEVRGVWIHTYGPTDWDRVMRRLRDAGFNSIFVRVGRGGNVLYPSALLPRDAWAARAGGDELQRAVKAARRHGIDFHAWRVCYHMRSAPKSYYDRVAGEDRLVRDPKGEQSFWANPADPRNAEMEYQALMEIVRKYDVQGVHLDYIRYPDDPHYDFDYGPVSRREFEKATGKRVPRWPEDVISGPLKSAYEDWERECVNRLVQRMSLGVKSLKPGVKLSAAVWRNHRRYRAAIKQDWPLWVERGWLDFVVPMDYIDGAESFAETVKAQVSVTGGRMPMVAGIGTWLQPSVDDVVRQVEIARRAGAAGFILFAYNDSRIERILDALAQGATRTPALPAYRAPDVTLRLEGALARKDAPYAAAEGARLQVNASLRGATDGPIRVGLEDPDGRMVADAGTLDRGKPSTQAEVTLPPGSLQLVARGTRSGRPFVVRGPLVDGLPAWAMNTLRDRDHPPRVEGEGKRVGVYAEGWGADSLLSALEREPGVRAFPLHCLRPDHLAVAQTILLPQLRDVADLTPAAVAALRDWVEGGGRLILTRDAVGYRWHPALFAEVGRGASAVARQPLKVTLPGEEPWVLEPAYFEHVRIAPAPGAAVLARETGKDAAPAIVAGAVGRGRVVLIGTLPGVQGDGALTPTEARLLRGLVSGEW